MTYKWKNGAHLSGDVEAVGKCLEKIRERDGVLTTDAVIREAKAAKSPLHRYIEWDDRQAAAVYREVQARYLIRSIVTVLDEGDGEALRAFVVVTTDDQDGYQSLRVAMNDEAMRQQVIARAKRELADWRERYRELKELADIFAALDGALAIAV